MTEQKFYVYSKSGCGFCDRLIQFMDSKGIQYEKFDLDNDFTVEELTIVHEGLYRSDAPGGPDGIPIRSNDIA